MMVYIRGLPGPLDVTFGTIHMATVTPWPGTYSSNLLIKVPQEPPGTYTVTATSHHERCDGNIYRHPRPISDTFRDTSRDTRRYPQRVRPHESPRNREHRILVPASNRYNLSCDSRCHFCDHPIRKTWQTTNATISRDLTLRATVYSSVKEAKRALED